jgi:ariadne-1
MLCAAGVTVPEPPAATTPTPIRSHSSSNQVTPTRRPTRATSKLLALASGSKSSSPKSPSTSNNVTHLATSKPVKPSKPQPFVCPICFDDTPDLPTLSLDCEHLFCVGCWSGYLTSKIGDEGEHCIRCMAEGCAVVAPDNFIRSVLIPESGAPASVLDIAQQEVNQVTWARFQELLVRHFVASNPNLKYCPYPSCTNTVSCPSAASKASLASVVPTVSCGARGVGSESQSLEQSQTSTSFGIAGKEHKFCFGCPIESDHRPIVCGAARMWLKKCRDDSETANWIKSNTKECSMCMSTIEKNGGCK